MTCFGSNRFWYKSFPKLRSKQMLDSRLSWSAKLRIHGTPFTTYINTNDGDSQGKAHLMFTLFRFVLVLLYFYHNLLWHTFHALKKLCRNFKGSSITSRSIFNYRLCQLSWWPSHSPTFKHWLCMESSVRKSSLVSSREFRVVTSGE